MIEIKNLTKQFQNETVITYHNITFQSGKSYMLLGASGCGKSTLLNMIAGVLAPTSGEILIDGVSMTAKTQAEKDKFRIQKIGYIFQDFKLINDMTVMDNINILKLEGVTDMNGALALRNAILHIDRKDVKLPEGHFFLADIEGLEVRDAQSGAVLGKVHEVLTLPANNVYVVRGGERELLIPAVPTFIAETNVEEGFLRVNMKEGL